MMIFSQTFIEIDPNPNPNQQITPYEMRKIIIQEKKLLKLTGALKHIITKYYACSTVFEHA